MDNRKLKNCQTSDLTLRPLSLCEGREGEWGGVEGLADTQRERERERERELSSL